MSSKKPKLKRTLSVLTLSLFGIGDILGAGIYGLIGEVAGLAGNWLWLSFTVAFVIAALTGLSYAELSSRIPRAGAEAYYALAAFKNKVFSEFVGFLVFLSALVSIATVSHIFAAYAAAMFGNSEYYMLIQILYLLVITITTLVGIQITSFSNIICTAIEVSGLLIVIAAGFSIFGTTGSNINPDSTVAFQVTSWESFALILSGSIIAFYSFLGFEDMANLAEETVDARKTVPKAIIVTLLVTWILYILTAFAATMSIPPDSLASSKAPLLAVVRNNWPMFPEHIFSLIALFAIFNTGLINLVMGSRLLYGMSEKKLAPKAFGRMNHRYQTPHFAIIFLFFVSAASALIFKKATLAGSTSFALLFVFLAMNLSLLLLKREGGKKPVFQTYWLVPITACVLIPGVMFFVSQKALLTFATMAVALVLGLLVPRRLRHKLE